MKIVIVTPAAARSKSGNRNTARRWARLLEEAGYRVAVQVEWDGRPVDLMIALHARKSYPSLKRFRETLPDAPLVLALTGTDLYRDIRTHAQARESMELADRIIVLQDRAPEELKPELWDKVRIIYQSAEPANRLPPLKTRFEVCILGHLREEKDPFRCTMALRHLPAESRIRVVHMGRPMSPEMEQQALAWMAKEPRYRWIGEIPHWQARRRLARSRLMVISSRMEGGANVVCEALASGVPVIASAVPGNIGMLGQDYEGYYPVEDEHALAQLLWRAESTPAFLRRLEQQCALRARLVTRDQEKQHLERLVSEFYRPAARRSGTPQNT